MGYELDKDVHWVYSLNYHSICCVKYRRKIFDTDEITNRLKERNISLAERNDIEILNQETDLAPIHILFKTRPPASLTKFINSLKGVSSRYIFQEFPEIKEKVWKGHLWSPSYLVVTTGQVTLDQLKRYGKSQGE